MTTVVVNPPGEVTLPKNSDTLHRHYPSPPNTTGALGNLNVATSTNIRGSQMDVDHDGWIAVDAAVQSTASTNGVIETQQ
jgi:hypothetical protein